MTLVTYHGSVTEKRATLSQLRAHRKADEIIQGVYWESNGHKRGCAVGCLTHDPSGGHALFPEKLGIPVQLAYLIDQIFESLPVDEAKDWPVSIMSAIPVGADLTGVWDRWCTWMLRRLIAKSPQALPEVEAMAVLFERAVGGEEPPEADWAEAARAARAARAAWAAEAAWAARAAEGAWAAEAARAAWAAEGAWAARAAEAARAAARHEWARAAATEIVRLVKAA